MNGQAADRFDQGDDGIAIKSGTNQDGWRLNSPSQNIVIRNYTFVEGSVAIGSELSGGIRNVYIHDCRIEPRVANSQLFHLLHIKTNRRRGGFVDNIALENVDASRCKSIVAVLVIDTDVLCQWRNPVPTYEERLTPISNVTVRNVKAGQAQTLFKILGDTDKPVKNVTIDTVSIDTVQRQKNRYENAENVREEHIHIGNLIEKPDKENRNK